ncbi:afadin-like [Nerophis ophidion]|uniref:afadin-like n=1 Tax=Nerophis ophidion TaxID=159077 RepID=UPI002ADF4418|nr:afadin-like [Nerophis ophidion]
MPADEEREKLSQVIREWNNNRLDLFEISEPDKNLVFQGVMRFYLEESSGENVATKCLRFSSNASAGDVVQTLSEKFRPDMKMLTDCFSLYEVHGKEERKVNEDERPLVVQLNWNSDDREGRFVLKQTTEDGSQNKEKGGVIQTFKRTLSRKEKKNKNKVPDRPAENWSPNGNPEAAEQCRGTRRQEDVETNHTGSPQPDFWDPLGLPLGITISDHLEDDFLSAVINSTNSSTVHFKLSPAYALYAASRSMLQRPGSSAAGTMDRVTALVNKMVALIGKTIQIHQDVAGALAFWMANTSELLDFLENDKDLSGLTRQSRLCLSHLVHQAYSSLIQCLQSELQKHLPTFLVDPEQHGPLPVGIEMVLNTLMNAMSLLRRYRVNPALTIQLFSQLFHFISSWLFNRLMSPESGTPGLRSHYWGATLRQRLSGIEAWAERQGLELAADCHLGHIIQASRLLTMKKYAVHDAKDISHACFKLNSLQLHALLAGYFYATNEPDIPADLMEAVVASARTSADEVIGGEGRDIRLEESLHLHLPFLLPEGGYSCSDVTGIPPGFRDFLEPISRRGLCSLTYQKHPKGDWTVFFTESTPSRETPSLGTRSVTVTLKKALGGGMGVSIVAAKGAGQDHLGIYIKSIVKGGPADTSGQLTAGDQLLSVDGQSLLGLSQERAAAIMMHTGPMVTLQVAKFAARDQGLGTLLFGLTPGEAHSQSGQVVRSGAWQKNRQLYRSQPNRTNCTWKESKEDVRGNKSFSNLCTDIRQREYLTLPALTSETRLSPAASRPALHMFQVSLPPVRGHTSLHKMTFLRQALSQENLCVDTGGPLLDKSQSPGAKQTTNYHSHLPVRPSSSTQDIFSAEGTRAGLWRTPFLQDAPTPCVQPVRIDIPVGRPCGVQANPLLTTFQQGALRAGQNPRNIYTCPLPPRAKPQMSITPTKHVSFQEPPTQQKQGAGPTRPRHTEARERPEKPEKTPKLRESELRDKAGRGAEDGERLRRLSLEWRFQKRLQEGGQDEGEDEDLDMMVTIQELDSRVQNKRGAAANTDKAQTETLAAQKEEKKDHESSGCLLKERQPGDKTRRMSAPEKLTFKERRRLFSLPSRA